MVDTSIGYPTTDYIVHVYASLTPLCEVYPVWLIRLLAILLQII